MCGRQGWTSLYHQLHTTTPDRIILQNGEHFVFLDAPVSLVDWVSLHDGGVKVLCEVKTFVAFTFLFPIFEYFQIGIIWEENGIICSTRSTLQTIRHKFREHGHQERKTRR